MSSQKKQRDRLLPSSKLAFDYIIFTRFVFTYLVERREA